MQSKEDNIYVEMNRPGMVTPYDTIQLDSPVYDYVDNNSLFQSRSEENRSEWKPNLPPRDSVNLRSRTIPVIEKSQSHEFSARSPPLVTCPSRRTYLQIDKHKPRSLSPLRIFDSLDQEKLHEYNDRQVRQKIIIKGIPVDMSIKDIGISLESGSLSIANGFEDIKIDRTHKEAIVTLKSRQAKNEEFKRPGWQEKFYLHETEVVAFPFLQEKYDPLKLYILGLTSETSTEYITKCVEQELKMQPLGVIREKNPEIALLCFKNPPDLTCIQSDIEGKALTINEWEIQPVERTKRVRIKGAAERTTHEDLKHYFENELFSKDGATESIVYRDSHGDYIITFEHIEDAESVVKQGIHIVNDVQLDVCFHYPCIDGDEEYHLNVPKHIQLKNLNKHMCRFLQFAAQYRKDLEEMVSSHHGRVIWPDEKGESYLCIKCNVSENDRTGLQKVKDWKQHSAGVVSEICKMLSVHYKYFALEVLGRLKSEVKKIGVSYPQSVIVSFEENKVAIAGETKYVEELSAKTEDIVSSIERELDGRGDHLTKILIVKCHEIELIREANIIERLKNVKASVEKGNIVVKGRKKMVDDAVKQVTNILKDFPKEKIEDLTMMESSLLQTNETAMYIKKKIQKSKITGVWEFTEDASLVMYSKNTEELKTAISILKSSIKRSKITMDTKTRNSFHHGEGKMFLERTEKKYRGRVSLKIYKKELCVVSLDCLQQEINERIMKYLDAHSFITEILPLDPGVFRYILSYKRNVIEEIEKQYKETSVEIDIIDKQTRKGFLISGEKECCKLAFLDLHVIADTVTRVDVPVKWPLIDKFIRSLEGINELNKIELAEKCIVRISTDDMKVFPEKSGQSVLAECRIGNCKVEILEHDIVEKEVEFIVNPTNTTMDNKLGFGSTLVDRGGFSIQKDCNDYIQGAPCLREGDIFVGTAGCLPYRGIIHVVVPSWTDGMESDESILSHVVTKCLIEADARNSTGIAFPPIGTGRLGYPEEKVAEIMIRAVKTYLMENGTETFLRHIYICNINRDTLQFFVKAIEKGFGQTVIFTSDFGDEYNDVTEPVKSEKHLKEITKEIVIGTITSENTDVIVNSTNDSLDLQVGTLSRSLLQQGGQSIMIELKKNYPDGIEPGDIAETTGGDLKCKAIFHGVLVKWDKGQGYAETILTFFVRSCLLIANRRRFVSIAFPVLGAGNLEFPPDRIAEIMYDAIESFEIEVPDSSLRNIRIVIRSEDENSLKAFEEYKSQSRKNRQPSRLSDISSRKSCQAENLFMESSGNDYTTTIGGVILNIEQGDLTTATNAIIVNSVPENLNIDCGKISRAIFRAAGKSIQDEANSKRKIFKQSGLIMTSAGRLLCQKIIHAKARNSSSGWKKAIKQCLAEVEKSSLSSVSFPALGTGGKGIPPAEMARAMVEAFQDYILGEDYQKCLKTIQIIIYEMDMVDTFIKESKAVLGNSTRKSIFQELKFWDRKPSDEAMSSDMIFHVYSESQSGQTNVLRRIEELHKEENITVQEDLLSQLSASQILRFKQIGETYGIHVTESKEGFTISGYGKNVEIVKKKIQEEMNKA